METVEKYAVEVIADSSDQFCGNGLRFGTVEEAKAYAADLFCRWTAVKTWRVVAPCGWGRRQTVVLTREVA